MVFGVGNPHSDLMFVGEGPGEQEDLQGLPFVGRSGQLLDRLILEEMGLTRENCYIANTIKCRPPGNRDPLPDEIEACRPYLEKQLDLVNPRVLVTLGNFATKLLLGTSEGISQRGDGHTRTVRGTWCPLSIRPPRSGAAGRSWPRCGPTSSAPKKPCVARDASAPLVLVVLCRSCLFRSWPWHPGRRT